MHGRAGWSEWQHALGQFTENGGGIAVYPQALGAQPTRQWNARPGSVDVRYVARLTSWLHAMGCGSPATTQANGFSMGAMLTSRLACDAPAPFHSFGMVAGALPTYCQVDKSKVITIVHGSKDWVVGWDGAMFAFLNVAVGGNYKGITKDVVARDWQRVHRCPTTTTRVQIDAVTTVTTFTCLGAGSTMLVAHTGEHTWDADPRFSRLSTTRLLISRTHD